LAVGLSVGSVALVALVAFFSKQYRLNRRKERMNNFTIDELMKW
jgi:hypothetical protein